MGELPPYVPDAESRAVFGAIRTMMDDAVNTARTRIEQGQEPIMVAYELFMILYTSARLSKLPGYTGFAVAGIAVVELAQRDIRWEASIKDGV